MEQISKKKLMVVSGRAHPDLAERIAVQLGVELTDCELVTFPNGELHCRFADSVRGVDLFIIQTHACTELGSVNDAIMEHLIMVDAARRASAKRITVVAPFYGYGRQDRKAEGREPISAKLVANMFAAAGAKRLVSVDLHSGQIQGFFDGPVDHLTAMPVLVEWMAQNLGGDLVVVSPDAGRVKVAERYAKELHADIAMVHKRRVRLQSPEAGAANGAEQSVVEAKGVVGNVEGRPCVLIDDMIDTGGTLVAAAEELVKRGASEVYACATHGVLSGPALERISASVIKKVVITDTVPLSAVNRPDYAELIGDRIEVLSAAKIIADALDAVFVDSSVSEIFKGQNQS